MGPPPFLSSPGLFTAIAVLRGVESPPFLSAISSGFRVLVLDLRAQITPFEDQRLLPSGFEWAETTGYRVDSTSGRGRDWLRRWMVLQKGVTVSLSFRF